MNKLYKDPVNLIVAGVGGQGNVMVSLVVGNALVQDRYFVTIGETYGASQRGGSVMSHVKVSAVKQYSPLIPEGQGDIIMGMEPVETMRILKSYGNGDVVTIVNPRPVYPVDFTGSAGAVYPDLDVLLAQIKSICYKTYIVPATAEAQKMGNPMMANMILIGALVQTGWLPVRQEALEKTLHEMFPKAVMENIEALNRGRELLC